MVRPCRGDNDDEESHQQRHDIQIANHPTAIVITFMMGRHQRIMARTTAVIFKHWYYRSFKF
jgi:hypothetical protein